MQSNCKFVQAVFSVPADLTIFSIIQKAPPGKGITPFTAWLEWIPSTTVPVNDIQAEDISKLIEKLEQDDDVQKVLHNTR